MLQLIRYFVCAAHYIGPVTVQDVYIVYGVPPEENIVAMIKPDRYVHWQD